MPSRDRTVWVERAMIGTGRLEFMMPPDAQILCVGRRHSGLAFYYECEPKEKTVARKFLIVMTGEPITDLNRKYIGTVFFEEGNFVVHVYELL